MKRNASNYERNLLRKLWDCGFVAFRIAGSGSSSYPSADIIAIKNEKVYVFEVKTTRSEKIYINPSQMWELERIRESGVKIFIAVRFINKLREWRFIDFSILENNKISLEFAKERGIKLEDL